LCKPKCVVSWNVSWSMPAPKWPCRLKQHTQVSLCAWSKVPWLKTSKKMSSSSGPQELSTALKLFCHPRTAFVSMQPDARCVFSRGPFRKSRRHQLQFWHPAIFPIQKNKSLHKTFRDLSDELLFNQGANYSFNCKTSSFVVDLRFRLNSFVENKLHSCAGASNSYLAALCGWVLRKRLAVSRCFWWTNACLEGRVRGKTSAFDACW